MILKLELPTKSPEMPVIHAESRPSPRAQDSSAGDREALLDRLQPYPWGGPHRGKARGAGVFTGGMAGLERPSEELPLS